MKGLTCILFLLAWTIQGSVFATVVGSTHHLSTTAAPSTDAWPLSVQHHLAVPTVAEEGSDASDSDQAEIAQVVPAPIYAKARLVQMKKMSPTTILPSDHLDEHRRIFCSIASLFVLSKLDMIVEPLSLNPTLLARTTDEAVPLPSISEALRSQEDMQTRKDAILALQRLRRRHGQEKLRAHLPRLISTSYTPSQTSSSSSPSFSPMTPPSAQMIDSAVSPKSYLPLRDSHSLTLMPSDTCLWQRRRPKHPVSPISTKTIPKYVMSTSSRHYQAPPKEEIPPHPQAPTIVVQAESSPIEAPLDSIQRDADFVVAPREQHISIAASDSEDSDVSLDVSCVAHIRQRHLTPYPYQQTIDPSPSSHYTSSSSSSAASSTHNVLSARPSPNRYCSLVQDVLLLNSPVPPQTWDECVVDGETFVRVHKGEDPPLSAWRTTNLSDLARNDMTKRPAFRQTQSLYRTNEVRQRADRMPLLHHSRSDHQLHQRMKAGASTLHVPQRPAADPRSPLPFRPRSPLEPSL